MPKAPDGTVMDESSSDEDIGAAVGGAEKEAEGCGGPNQTQPVVGCPSMQGTPSPFPRSHR